KWHSDTGTELVTTRNDLDVTRQNLEKAQKLSDLASLDAPEDAVVLNVGKISSGSVASGGAQGSTGQDPLVTLVPIDAVKEADVDWAAGDRVFTRGGVAAQLTTAAYRLMQQGRARGKIKPTSEGSFTPDENNTPVPPYFKVRVTITDAHLRHVPKDFRLIPGM